MLRNIVLFMLLLHVNLLLGQIYEDSVQLEEVRIYGMPLKEYTAGSKVEHIDSTALKLYASNNMAELLSQRSPLYFKIYGAGMTSTVAFRGTSSSHTAVLWNGININSISLGQSDFSTFPVAAAENVAVLYGASSALYGSGAIGGTIHLYNAPDWEKGVKIGLQQEIGSFDRFYSGASVKWGNGSLESKTTMFLKQAKNDFPYKVKGFSGIKEVRQKNASLKHKGIMQDINYRFRSNQYVSLNFWYNNLDREIQPTITAPNNKDHQLDENMRVVANYHLNNQWGHLNARVAYLYDVLDFNDSPSFTHRYIAALQHEVKLSEQLKISGGADITHIVANVNGYGEEKQEDRTDVFILAQYAPVEKLVIALNARQSFVTGFSAPISPTLGFEYSFIENDHSALKWKGNVSRSYRVPTLNDRFWSPGGNPNLKSESGLAYESGLGFSLQKERATISMDVTGYFNNVDDWIIWLTAPGGTIWSPENIEKVYARGLEVSSRWNQQYGSLDLFIGLNYAYTKSTHENKADKKYGQQLMYVPLHNGSLHIGAKLCDWFLQANASYTGSRLTTIDELNAFWLSDWVLGKNIKLRTHQLSAFFKVYNLFDKEYFNYESRAMPGRNYSLSIHYTFNN